MKVKSCPCCGNMNNVVIETKFISNNVMYRVICSEVYHIDGVAGCGLNSAWCNTIQEAVERWNKRTQNEHEHNI